MCHLVASTLLEFPSEAASSAGYDPIRMFDVEDDVDVPPGWEIRHCTKSGAFWLVRRTCTTCPDCGHPVALPS
jgi:hypothetical protein